MNTFVEALKGFGKHSPKVECNWERMVLAAEQERLKAMLEARDAEHLIKQEIERHATCRGNPLLRMNE